MSWRGAGEEAFPRQVPRIVVPESLLLRVFLPGEAGGGKHSEGDV